MQNGYIKLYRKSLENPLFRKPLFWHYFLYCLFKANHCDKKIIWNKKELIIERGSFVTGRDQAAKECGLSARNVRTAQEVLINLGMIEKSTSKTTSKFTYLSICNYDKYQELKPASDQQSDQQVTSKRPASDQQVTTTKNDKNLKNEKNEKKKDTPLPENFSISDNVKKWANEKGHRDLEKHLEYFINSAIAKGYKYIDWDRAFMNAISGDWAKLKQQNTQVKTGDEVRIINGVKYIGPYKVE